MPPRDDAERTVAILRQLFGEGFAREFSVRLWNGSVVPARGQERFVFRVETPYALRAALAPPLDLSPGRAFVQHAIDVDGDLESAIDRILGAVRRLTPARIAQLAAMVARLPRPPQARDERTATLRGARHSRARDAAAIGFHYNQPIEFYASFLDPNLVYSCAYFDDGIDDLGAAQIAKIDHVLRKLRVAPGERLLDIGCGWGALVIRAAEKFGARAHGITLSRSQYEEAARRIQARGLGDRATVELCDYRSVQAEYDKISSIGMVEHVGRERLAEYFEVAYRSLRPGGLFLNHGISDQEPGRRGARASGFIDRYVFPDGDLLPIATRLLTAERTGFEVRDVESLREHYARTLRTWVRNLERNADAAIAVSDERTWRIWRIYMAGSAQGFASGRLSVFQSLLERPMRDGRTSLPSTRRDLYRA
ncbi:MAG: class I SAM-dependent methyltransferase [Vulcanimicrobiaceae bacterium]